jgi:hypothetical protein
MHTNIGQMTHPRAAPTLDLSTWVFKSVPRKAWTRADFADLASRNAIDNCLQRMTTAGQIRQTDRGLYDQSRINPFCGNMLALSD